MTLDEPQIAWVAAQVFLCVLIADFITGVVHWGEDTYSRLDWPEPIRSLVVEPNVVHHEDQTAFLAETWWNRCWHTLLVSQVVRVAAAAAGIFTWHWAVVGLIAGLGNEMHAWTHRRAPWPARMLQEMGVLTTPQQHAKHHKPPYDRAYCTVTNFLNPVLDAVHFWRAIESLLSLVGLRLQRLTSARRGV